MDEVVEEVRAGTKVRFRVSDPGQGSASSWSVETTKHSGDVYVFHREGARFVKSSLHESGQWHFGATKRGQAHSPSAPRYFGISHDREEIAPGWYRAMVIVVPHSELRNDYEEAVTGAGVVDIPVDRSADATCLVILLGDADASRIQIDNSYLVATMRRGDGGQVIVYATPTSLDQSVHNALSEEIAAAKSDLHDHGWAGRTPTRIVINGVSTAGYLQQIEIAVDPDSLDP